MELRESCWQKVETVDTDIRETEDCREEKVEKVLQVELPRRASGAESLMMEEQKRRFSEAGVNRRPSAAHILTEVSCLLKTRIQDEGQDLVSSE